MADQQFHQILNSLLSTDNDVRQQAEVSSPSTTASCEVPIVNLGHVDWPRMPIVVGPKNVFYAALSPRVLRRSSSFVRVKPSDARTTFFGTRLVLATRVLGTRSFFRYAIHSMNHHVACCGSVVWLASVFSHRLHTTTCTSRVLCPPGVFPSKMSPRTRISTCFPFSNLVLLSTRAARLECLQ